MLSKSAERAILELQERWLERELAGDAAGVLDCCTSDVEWFPPAQPALRGPAAIRSWLLERPPVPIPKVEIGRVRMEGAGGLAYKLADFTTWIDSPAQPSGTRATGTHLWMLREVKPGSWRVAMVTWTIGRGTGPRPG